MVGALRIFYALTGNLSRLLTVKEDALIEKLPAARHARVAALFAVVVGLSACGGGGGGGAGEPGGGELPTAPAPAPAAALSLADCQALPTGVTNNYLNSALDGSWAKREWKTAASASFPEATVARHDYSSATATNPSQVWYFKSDGSTVTTLGRETLGAGGGVETRVQFVDHVESIALAAGTSETIDYTVKAVLPPGADTTQRLVRTFTANREVTLPGGRLNTCMVDTVLSAAATAGGTLSEQSRERLHFAPGLGVVKRYLTRTNMNFVLIDKDQTYVNELVSSSAPPTYIAATADTAPTLAQCAAIASGQLLQYTASNGAEALSDKRRTLAGSFNGAASTLVSQRSMRTDKLSKISHFDASSGALQELGYHIYGASETNPTSTTTFSDRPDLSTAAEGQTVNYTETTMTDGAATSSNDSFTFVGHEKVATYAGDFDTCKVRFDYGNKDSEIFYLVPDAYWVRLDATVDGVRTTREMVKLN